MIGTIPTPREHTETYAGLDSALEAMTSGLLVLLPLALVMMMSVPIGQHVRFEGGQNTMFIVAGLGLAALVALAVI